MRIVIVALIGFFILSPAHAVDSPLLSAEEQAWLRAHPEPIRVHNELNWQPYNFNEAGEPKGYSIDYMDLAAQKLGIKIRYVSGPSWSEFLEMMKNRSLDVMLNIASTKDRRKYLAFTEPYLITSVSLYVRNSDNSISDLDDLAGKKIAFTRGFFFAEFIRKYYPDIEVVTFDSTLASFIGVDKGLADAAMEVPVVARRVMRDAKISSLKRGGKVTDTRFIATIAVATRKDEQILHSIIQKGMDAITLVEESAIRRKWDLEEVEPPLISKDEKAHLSKLGELRACVNPGRLPLEAVNLDGTLTGISSEFVKLMQERVGVPIKLVTTQDWLESLKFAKEGKCDLLPMAIKTQERQHFLNFTSPWLSLPYVVATRHNQIYISNINQIINETIGVVKGLATGENLLAAYPNIKLEEVDSVSAGLKDVESGKLFGFIDTVPTISRTLQAEAITDVKISGNVGSAMSYGIAVRGDDRQLLAILERSLGTIDKDLISDIYNRWLAVAYIDRFDYTRLWQALFAVFLITLYLIYRYRQGLRTTAELKNAMCKAEEANKIKSRFLAAASHDLRQPIHAISLFSTALQNRLKDGENANLVSKVQSSLGSLGSMLDGLLDMSRLENHAIVPHPHDFAVQVILDEIQMEYGAVAKAKNLDLRIVPSSLILHSDQALLSRIVGNFVTNAIRYTDQGRLLVGCRLLGDTVRLEIWDTGKGISEDDVSQIFDPHKRLDGARKHAAEGLGLGLSISDGLARLLEHPLTVRSNLGAGSVFSVEVPIGTSVPDTLDDQMPKQTYKTVFQGHTILVVDDDEIVLDGMKTVLSDWGCHVIVARGTDEALEVTRNLTDKLDVVISDYHLSEDETGIGLLEQIDYELGRDVPAIIISGDTQPERRREIEAVGYFLLTKPIQPVSLRPLLRRQLRLRAK